MLDKTISDISLHWLKKPARALSYTEAQKFSLTASRIRAESTASGKQK